MRIDEINQQDMTAVELLTSNNPYDKVEISKEVDQNLEKLIKKDFELLIESQASSRTYHLALNKKKELQERVTTTDSTISFYDGIMSKIFRLKDSDLVIGYIIDRQTDGAHWKHLAIFTSHNFI